jgi:hypothetical protein
MCTIACGTSMTACSGACVDLQTDGSNCGSCGHACASGTMCSAGSCMACGATVSFGSQIQPIFTANCTTGCHGGVRPAAGMSLTSGSSYASLVNRMASGCTTSHIRVVPGSVSNSYLINKLTGVGMCSGSQMPLTGSISSSQIDQIRAWICNGALNN